MELPAIEGGKPTRKEYLIFGKPQIGQEEIDEVIKVLKSGWIGTGPKVQEFEANYRKYIGSKYAVAVNSCTAALHLSLLCSGIGEGDEVITTPMTFGSTVNVIEHVRAKPVFVDIEEDSYNIDAEKIEAAITPRTKAIIPVHFGGLACNMDRIYDLAKKNNLLVIEDAAHAIGAEYRSNKIGSFGNPTCFSFYPTKNITTIEGGMVCLNNEELAEKIRIYSLHGQSKHAWQRYGSSEKRIYEFIYPGYKCNMPDVNAALGIIQLKKIEEFLLKRCKYANIYLKELNDCNLIELPPVKGNRRHAWHLFSFLLKIDKLRISRIQFMQAMHKENIGTGVHYVALHQQSYYKNKYKFKDGMFKRAEYVSDRTISVPLQTSMSEGDIYDVIKATKKVLNYYKKNNS